MTYLIYDTTILKEQLILKSQQNEKVKRQHILVHDAFETITADCHYLIAKLEQENGYVDGKSHVVDDFARFSMYRGLYDQIRFLDPEGQEQIRINLLKNGQNEIVPKWALQSKGNRYYFRAAAGLKRGQLFISPMDLNVEKGTVERPFKPMIRVSGPVYDDKETFRGVVVLNYLARDLLSKLHELSAHHSSEVMLIDRDGYWLTSPWPEEEWGFMFDDGRNRTFGRRFPASWQHIKAESEGQILSEEGLFSYTTLYPILNIEETFSLPANSSKDTSRLVASSSENRDAFRWMLLSWVRPDVYFSNTRRFVRMMIAVDVLLSLMFLVGAIAISIYRIKRRLAEARVRFEADYNAAAAMIAGAISSMSNLQEVESLLLEEGTRFMSSRVAVATARSESTGQWQLPESKVADEAQGGIEAESLVPIFDFVAERKTPLLIDDIAGDKRFASLQPNIRALRRIAACPAIAAEQVVGVLAFGGVSQPYSDCQENVLLGLAHLYALAIQRQSAIDQILSMAHYDQLTGLTNRYLLEDRMIQMLKDAKRYQKRIACLFIDLDKFKPINDRFGHEVGDMVLKQTSKRLLDVVRESDTVARLGGDEFMVLISNIIHPADIKHIADRILQTIQRPIETPNHTHTVGASIGVSVYPDDGEEAAELTQRADEAMYDVKMSGRNGWKMYNTKPLPSMPALSAEIADSTKRRVSRQSREAWESD